MNFYKNTFLPSLQKSIHTSFWLLKIILPISLAVRFLDFYGVLAYIANFLNGPFMYMGLPGDTAIVFITSIFLPLYAPLALITSMSITLRELTILALMCQIAHNLPVECAIQGKTGSSFWTMFFLRIFTSIAVAVILNLVLPQDMGMPIFAQAEVASIGSISELLIAWLKSSFSIIILIIAIVFVLNILYRILVQFNLIEKLSLMIKPVLQFFGLSSNTGFLWLIGYIVGLAYGGALMADQMNEGKVTRRDADLLNYHLAVSHSAIEDNLLFVVLGVSIWWILITRLTVAWLVVWMRRLHIQLKDKWNSFGVNVQVNN